MIQPKVRPIIGRVGGKARLAPVIIKHLMRFEWSLYVEPFCGSAAVYFRTVQDKIPERIRERKHHPRFILNDADSRIVNLFRVCRDRATELALAAYFTPYSREEHRLAQLPQEGLSEVEEALGYLVDGWQSHTKDHGHGWGFSPLHDRGEERIFNSLPSRIHAASPHLGESQHETDAVVEAARRYLVDGWQSNKSQVGDSWALARASKCKTGGVRTHPKEFQSTPDLILTAVSALKRCYIENDDAVKVIERWSCPHQAIYADPPYVGKEEYYAHSWTADDHIRLAECLNRVEASAVVVSYYDCPELDDLYPSDRWERHYHKTVASSCGITRNSKTKERPKRTEMILVRKQSESKVFAVPKDKQLSLFDW